MTSAEAGVISLHWTRPHVSHSQLIKSPGTPLVPIRQSLPHLNTTGKQNNRKTTHCYGPCVNGYLSSFLKKVTKTSPAKDREEQNQRAVAVLPNVEGVLQSLRRYLQEHGIRTVFKSETTLRKRMVRAKDSVPQGKQDGVV